jgi:hypothetical protein
MISFFTILFIILGVNAVLMIFSLSGTGHKAKKTSTGISDSSTPKIYPIDLISSKYKKAI